MENTMCQETVAQWERFELRLLGPFEGNLYVMLNGMSFLVMKTRKA